MEIRGSPISGIIANIITTVFLRNIVSEKSDE